MPKQPILPTTLPAHFHTEDMTEAFKYFLPIVEQIPAAEVTVRSGDVNIARHNVERAVEAVTPRLGEVPAILPKVSVKQLLELPALALALVYEEGYDELRTVGVALWGIKSVDAYVPPLFSRDRSPRGAPPAPPAPPGTGG